MCQVQVTYVIQRGVVGVSDDSLKVLEDLSFGEDGAILAIQHIEPVLANEFPNGHNTGAGKHLQNWPRRRTTMCLDPWAVTILQPRFEFLEASAGVT